MAAARAARRAALKPYRKFSHGRWGDTMGPGAKSPGLVLVSTVQRNDDRRGYVVFVIGIGCVIEPYGRDCELTVLVEPLRGPKQ